MTEPWVSRPVGSVSARWLVREGLIDLRCLEDAVEPLQAFLQIELPQRANCRVRRGDISILWMAPLQWLIRVPEAEEQQLAAQLSECPCHTAVTIVSDAYVGLRLEGSGAARVLSEGCPLDLELLEPGRCARTVLARAQVLLISLDVAGGYDCYVERSQAEYVRQWITTAAFAFGSNSVQNLLND
jgi:sarcosine oxidase, subunit gamma